MKKRIALLFSILFSIIALGQNIKKEWQITESDPSTSITKIIFENGTFTLSTATETLQGNYTHIDDLLSLNFYDHPDQVEYYTISELTDQKLLLKNQTQTLAFTSHPNAQTLQGQGAIVPNQGFSFTSLWRGALGMLVLIFIAFVFSHNRSAINWKTVVLGLAAQLILAIGILEIPFVQSAFEWLGNLFILVLDFTAAGSEFLLGGLMNTESFGYIFLFQVLPTIIFFSALTSVLFYLGIIQNVVKAMAWVLTKLLGISGAESLSVAGNIFLGQTEAPLMIKAYLERMNKSEMLLVMVGGMSTVAGGVLAAYIGFLGGDDPALRLVFAKHLLAASVMAAPGAIVISK